MESKICIEPINNPIGIGVIWSNNHPKYPPILEAEYCGSAKVLRLLGPFDCVGLWCIKSSSKE
jgi:hypothetical protein